MSEVGVRSQFHKLGLLGGSLVSYLRFTLAWVFLANLPFWIAPHFIDARKRGYFNIEYILIGLLSLRVPRRYIFFVFYISCVVDVVITSSQIFYFTTNDLPVASVYITQLPLGRVLGISLLVSAITIVWSIVLLKVSPKATLGGFAGLGPAMLVFVLVLIGVDAFEGNNRAFSSRDSISSTKLSSAPCWSFSKVLLGLGQVRRAQVGPAESATKPLLNELRQKSAGGVNIAASRNIVLILVESYGMLRDKEGAALVSAPFNSPDVRKRYSVTTGTVPFDGPTVSGEFRELCGMAASLAVQPKDFSTCLPALLKQNGYATVSFHGFTGSMFARNKWYPLMSFDRSFFAAQMKGMPGVNICEGFLTGPCDADVAGLVGNYLASNSARRNFVYWLTLNSHLPLLRSLVTDDTFKCGTPAVPIPDADICRWMSVIHKAQSSIARLALRPDLPPTGFYIVGDHAPPFVLQERRNMFFPNVVPYLHLTPLG